LNTTHAANNIMNSERSIFYCNLGADLSLTEGVLFSLSAAFSISASLFDLFIVFIGVGTGGGNADVTGMAPDGDPVSFADSWSKNN